MPPGNHTTDIGHPIFGFSTDYSGAAVIRIIMSRPFFHIRKEECVGRIGHGKHTRIAFGINEHVWDITHLLSYMLDTVDSEGSFAIVTQDYTFYARKILLLKALYRRNLIFLIPTSHLLAVGDKTILYRCMVGAI